MVQPTGSHGCQRVGAARIDDVHRMRPVCQSPRPCVPELRARRDPDVEVRGRIAGGPATPSLTPKTGIVATHHAAYDSGAPMRHMRGKPERHALHAMADLHHPPSRRHLDFAGGDRSPAIAIAKPLHSERDSIQITVDAVDYRKPQGAEDSHICINDARDLTGMERGYNLIRPSTILDQVPDAPAAIGQVIACAGKGTRTPFVLAAASVVRPINVIYPTRVHDRRSVFWYRFIDTCGIKGSIAHGASPNRPGPVQSQLRAPLESHRRMGGHTARMTRMVGQFMHPISLGLCPIAAVHVACILPTRSMMGATSAERTAARTT